MFRNTTKFVSPSRENDIFKLPKQVIPKPEAIFKIKKNFHPQIDSFLLTEDSNPRNVCGFFGIVPISK